MTELINNTLQIISRISQSKCGYLLCLNNSGFDVKTIWGESSERFNQFNFSLLELFKSSGIDDKSIIHSSSFKELSDEISVESIFVQEILSFSEKNESVYILLFSALSDQFTDECKEKVISVLSLLSSQVKKWIDETNKSESVSVGDDKKPGEGFAENGLMTDWERNFLKLLEVSDELIFLLDKYGHIVLVNSHGAQLLDYSAEEIKGKHFTDLVEPEHNQVASEAFKEALRKKRIVNFEVILSSKYDRNIPFEINCEVIVKNGDVIGMFGTGKDLSRLKNFEFEISKLKPKLIEANRLLKVERGRTRHHLSLIEELNRLKREFVSNISHEFRTPLASIIGFSETIESDPDLTPDMKKEFNNVILNEGKRLAKLINDVLDLSGIEGGKITLNKTQFDVLLTLLNVINANENFAREKKIELVHKLQPEEILIEADEKLLEQAFNALIDNAIKFTQEHGRVRIIANSYLREFEVIISDTGIGIPEKDLPYIFQKFYRGSRSGFETVGTGVGLVFVKQIADLHKGLITVQSELGSGSTFVLKLPKISKILSSEVNIE